MKNGPILKYFISNYQPQVFINVLSIDLLTLNYLKIQFYLLSSPRQMFN